MIAVNQGQQAYANPELYLDNVDREFIERMNMRLTLYGQIPYTVPTRMIIEMIKESALLFYRQSYRKAKQILFYHLKTSDIVELMNDCSCGQKPCPSYPNCTHNHTSHHLHLDGNYKNLKGFIFKLPPFVSAVFGLYKTNDPVISSGPDGGSDEESSMVSYSMNQSLGANGLRGINNHFYQYERTVKLSETNMKMSSQVAGIPHHYNPATNTLSIHADIRSYSSFMLKCSCNVDVQYLYNDDLFIKYVFARCKKELKRLLGGHTFQLPGDVTMNADEICYGADEEIQSVEEILKNHNGIGDVILFR